MRSGGIPQRARPAFSPRHYSSSNDPLSQRASPRANKRSAITATKPKACRLRSHVRDLHPIPLFSRTRSACPGLPGSRSCHKSCVFDCDIRCISTGRAPGSCPIVRSCAGACPASPVPDWPFSARPWSACPAGARPQIPSGKGRSSSGWGGRAAQPAPPGRRWRTGRSPSPGSAAR